MTIKLMLAFVLAFVISSIFGKYYVPWLRKMKAGQEIKDNGPTWHMNKSGTPTMGGIMFILAVTVVCLTVGFQSMLKGNFVHLYILIFGLAFGAIGFLDDMEKLAHKQNLGLSAKKKFLLQLAVALIFIFILWKTGAVTTDIYVPFFQVSWHFPIWLYLVFAAFVIVGTVNAVNITDGVDGLASSTAIPVFLFFVVVSFAWGEKYLEGALFSSAMIGGLLGFLIYNFNPAKCFMGDTGSLFLGGVIAAMAFAYDMPLILITVAIVFLLETLSDIIQVVYFKLTHGKRVFRMAPFHHHLEMGGWTGRKWKEKELDLLFFSVSLVFAVISFVGVYGRFPN